MSIASLDDLSAEKGSRSVRRALDILDLLLEEDQPTPVALITSRLRIPKSTAYELVRTLTEGGYLERDDGTGRVSLGRRLYELGMAYKSRVDLLKEGGRAVEELRDRTGETVQLSILENDMMVVVVKEDGVLPIRIYSKVGSRVPVNWAAAGRLLVSDMPDEPLRNLLRREVRQSPSGNAYTDVTALVEQIRELREQGYALELNEVNQHAGCVAAPVIDAAGHCVASISIVAPEQRLG
jgi:DNA-binding IclR family transcriptional regulator